MIGKVDGQGRALLALPVSAHPQGTFKEVTAWIDTAFDGHLVFSMQLIVELQLDSLADTEAILADGSKVILETFLGYIDWFGKRVPLQIVANDGHYPLLGTGLLQQRILHIDYVQQQLSLE